jgi:hypothetical protein
MTIKASGSSLSYSEIAAEFGSPTGKNLGAYRVSQAVGTLTLPLDTGIPSSGTIRFSDFYSKKLNVVLNCTGMGDLETRVNARSLYESPTSRGGVSVSVIGGFKGAPYDTSTSKVYINTNTRIGSAQGDSRIVAFRTGGWQSGTDLRLENGTSGLIVGSGGGGGGGGGTAGGGGGNGTSALGIDYPTTIVNRGTIRSGGGGGGGGGGGAGRARFRRRGGFGFSSAYSSGGGGGGGSGWPAGGGGGSGAADGSLYGAGGGGGSSYNEGRSCSAYGGAGGGGGYGSAGGSGGGGSFSRSGTGIDGGTYAGTAGAGGGAGSAIIYFNDSSGSSLINFATVSGSTIYNSAIF